MEILLFVAWMLYLLPWLVAEVHDHPRHVAVLLANLALGWTLVGWIALLCWARRRAAPDAAPALVVLEGGGEHTGAPRARLRAVG